MLVECAAPVCNAVCVHGAQPCSNESDVCAGTARTKRPAYVPARMRYQPENSTSIGSGAATHGFIIATSNGPSVMPGALPSGPTSAGARREMGRPGEARTSQ